MDGRLGAFEHVEELAALALESGCGVEGFFTGGEIGRCEGGEESKVGPALGDLGFEAFAAVLDDGAEMVLLGLDDGLSGAMVALGGHDDEGSERDDRNPDEDAPAEAGEAAAVSGGGAGSGSMCDIRHGSDLIRGSISDSAILSCRGREVQRK